MLKLWTNLQQWSKWIILDTGLEFIDFWPDTQKHSLWGIHFRNLVLFIYYSKLHISADENV